LERVLPNAHARWANMMHYLDEGAILIDNNLAENAIRPMTIGRKNYLFCGNDEAAGGWTAILYSLIEICKEQNINPRMYLNDVVAQMPYINPRKKKDQGEKIKIPEKQLPPLLPQNWIKTHPEALMGTNK